MAMKALAAVAGFAVALVMVGPGIGVAGDVKPSTGIIPNPFPFAMTPPPASLNPRPAAPVPGPPAPVPQTPGLVYPCCAPPQGYWAYQWVPTSSTTYAWVPGFVTADGTLVEGSYQPQVVTGGYYQPIWISGY
jgi:hypothetical protein